jgi:hypothetical protein
LNKRDGVTSPGWITMAVRDGSTSQDITSWGGVVPLSSFLVVLY